MGQNIDVFVSYSTNDKLVADALVHFLEEKKIRCWYSGRDSSGKYSEAIVEAISDASVCIFILSACSMGSEHCRKEIDLALKKKRTIIPFRIEDCQLSDSMQYYLCDLHWIDAFPEPEKAFGVLLNKMNVACSAQVLLPASQTIEAVANDPIEILLPDVPAVQRESISRFLRWYADWLFDIFMGVARRINEDIALPTFTDLMVCVDRQFERVGEEIAAEMSTPLSIPRFVKICNKLADMIAISAERKDLLFNYSKWMPLGFSMLSQSPKGLRGWYNEAEAADMAYGVYEVFRMLAVNYAPMYDASENCGIKFIMPLYMPRFPKGENGLARTMEMMFLKDGDRYTFKRNVFDSLERQYALAQQNLGLTPRDMPMVVMFDKELALLNLLCSVSPDGRFSFDKTDNEVNFPRNRKMLDEYFCRRWQKIFEMYSPRQSEIG